MDFVKNSINHFWRWADALRANNRDKCCLMLFFHAYFSHIPIASSHVPPPILDRSM